MRRASRIVSLISAVVALTGLTTCSPSGGGILVAVPGPGAVVAVIVSPSSASMEVGLTIQLIATLVNSVGTEVPGSVSWASSNSNVASVSNAGRVTGVAQWERQQSLPPPVPSPAAPPSPSSIRIRRHHSGS